MAETAVRVRGLRKRYGDVHAVDGVDLDISHGEVFALLGPNGAGKSTTVEILEGHRRRTAGEVSVLGADPAAARGETVLAPSVAAKLVTRLRSPVELSPREIEVLRLVARGRTNAEIGRELFISEATVKTHLLRAFGKLGVSDRTSAVTTALERGTLRPGDG